MRKILVLPIFILSILFKINAQTVEDTTAIKLTALNYIEGYFYKDAERFATSVHPELVKRTIRKDKNGKSYIVNLGASFMRMVTENNTNKNIRNPGESIIAEVTILDIYENIASVKVINNQYKFIDYLHMVRFNGEWEIINVLWENSSE